MSDLIIGVDAGGSKTRVLVSTVEGKTLVDVTGPGAAMAPGDADHCASIIASVVQTALTELATPKKRRGAKSTESKKKRDAKASSPEPVEESSADADNQDDSPYAQYEREVSNDMDLSRVVDEDEADDVDGDDIDENAGANEGDDDDVMAYDDADDEDESDAAEEEDAESPEQIVGEDVAEESEEAEDVVISNRRPVMLFAGVAGTGREEEQIALQQALERLDIADDVVVETDATIALADAFGEDSGIVLVAGTGSIAFGKSPAGMHARCGGWGMMIGDEGSGAWIGRKALSVVAAAHDGREPETALTGAVLTAAQLNEVEQLIPWSIAADKESLGALAPTVLAIAMQGDLRANAIIDMAVEELMLHVRALGKRLFIDERAAFDVALTGGLLRKGSIIRKRLEKRIKTAVPGATVKSEPVDGARGAIKLARLALHRVGV